MSSKKEKKALYFQKVERLFSEYNNILVVTIDNVSSSLMHKTRHALRGKAVMLMGKNTLVRRAMKNVKNVPGLQSLADSLKNNVGLVFTNSDLSEIRDIISQNKISGPAKPGQIAPCDVIVPKGNTGLEPTQTTFLQALNIATKISKGTIEIINDVKVITKGQKVGNSEATLLSKLKMNPFFFEITPIHVFEEGQMFPVSILDIKESDLLDAFTQGNQNVSAVCVATDIPTLSLVPYYLKDGFKNVCAVCESIGYSFALFNRYTSSVSSVVAVAPSSSSSSSSETKEETKTEEKKEEKEEEEEVDMEMGDLFGGDF